MPSTDDPITRRELEARFDAIMLQIASQKESVTIAMTAADRAVTKAEMSVEKRFENSNEWRNTVETLQRTYMPRTEFDQANTTVTDKINALTLRQNSKDDRVRGGADVWGYIVGAVGIISMIATIIYSLTRTH
jgi:multidrug resistance efflux pump